MVHFNLSPYHEGTTTKFVSNHEFLGNLDINFTDLKNMRSWVNHFEYSTFVSVHQVLSGHILEI